MQLVILDSISTDRNHLIQSLERYFKKRLIDFSLQECSSHKELFECVNFQSEKTSLFVSSIYQKRNKSDWKLVIKIRKINKDSFIFFTSNSCYYAAEAYKMQADGYLLKPIVTEELESSLNKCLKNLDFIYKKIRIHSKYMTMNIPLKDIIYIEVFNKTCFIHTKQKKTVTSSVSLSELEEELKNEGFLRCHKKLPC